VRILHVDKFLRRQGGAAGYMLDVAALQRGEGHEVEFFAMAHPGNEPATYEAMFPRLVELEPPPPTITGRLDATATMLWSARAARAMAAVADAFRPDVVHLHNIYHQLSPSILRPLRKRGIAVVLTAHDYKLVCPSYRMLDGEQLCDACVSGSALNAARRRCKDGSLGASAVLAVESSLHRAMRAYGPVHRFIAPSRFLAGQLARGGIASERIRQLNNFVDTSTIPARAGTGTGFLSVGRLSSEKGVDTLIEAVGLTPGAHLVVAGDGPERSYENMPLSVLETQAAAVPLIVTALGGLPELVRDGHSGLVVPPNDAPALAAALQRLQADPELAATLGRQGRQSALANHDPGAHLQALEGIYVEALAAADRPDRAAVPRR
jgi:glycosyltransferase involved in cell wall biosynthesis